MVWLLAWWPLPIPTCKLTLAYDVFSNASMFFMLAQHSTWSTLMKVCRQQPCIQVKQFMAPKAFESGLIPCDLCSNDIVGLAVYVLQGASPRDWVLSANNLDIYLSPTPVYKKKGVICAYNYSATITTSSPSTWVPNNVTCVATISNARYVTIERRLTMENPNMGLLEVQVLRSGEAHTHVFASGWVCVMRQQHHCMQRCRCVPGGGHASARRAHTNTHSCGVHSMVSCLE